MKYYLESDYNIDNTYAIVKKRIRKMKVKDFKKNYSIQKSAKLFIIILLMLFSVSNIYSEDKLDLDINIDLEKSLIIQKDVFGINGNLSSNQQPYNHADVIKLFKELGSPYIRFPGGTVANLYDWKTGLFKENPNGVKKHNNRVDKTNKRYKKLKRTYNTKTFLDFIKKSDASSFAIVLNIANETPQNTKEWMLHIKSLGHTVNKVELGNELYFPGYEKCYPNPIDYINAAKEHSIAVREIFPNCKIGLIISSIPYSDESFIAGSKDALSNSSTRRVVRAKAWDEATETARFYDAVIIHMYSKIGLKGNKKELYPNTDILKAYKYSLSYNDNRYPNVINMIKTKYPKKEIWVLRKFL